MLAVVSRSGLTSLVMAAAMATNPTMEFDKAPAILSSMGRTERVTASLRLPVLSCPYSTESVIVRIAVIWMQVAGR